MQAMAPGALPAAIARASVAQTTIRFIVVSESLLRDIKPAFNVCISAATWPTSAIPVIQDCGSHPN
jgi:hypothetical protein